MGRRNAKLEAVAIAAAAAREGIVPLPPSLEVAGFAEAVIEPAEAVASSRQGSGTSATAAVGKTSNKTTGGSANTMGAFLLQSQKRFLVILWFSICGK